MTVKNFFPQVWIARFLANLDKFLVYTTGAVVNRDYEGIVFNQGDVVRINDIGKVTVKNYTRDADIDAPEALNDAALTMSIDQAKYFNFSLDDLDAAQANADLMDRAMGRAAMDVRDAMDIYMAAKYTDAAAANGIGTDVAPVIPTKTDAYEYLVDLDVKLTDAKVPTEGRFCVVPPWFYGLLRKDARFIQATDAGQQVIANGRIGRASNFDVLQSHNVPNTTGTKYKVVAGHPMAWSFALGMNKIEGYRPEKRFADAVKGVVVYGGKVIRPEALAVATFNKS